MATRVSVVLLLLATVVCAQRNVDPKNIYHRVICVVPLVGAGTAADPKRPQYAPLPSAMAGLTTPVTTVQTKSGPISVPTAPAAPAILAYMHVMSDDGKYAIAEYVARDMAALQPIISDKSLKVFIKGQDSKKEIETEIRKYKIDFNLDTFGVVVP